MSESIPPSLPAHQWQQTLYIMFFAQMVTSMGFSSIFPFLPLYVKELGSSSGLSVELLAGLVFSSQAISMMLASPVWGALADRYGRKLMVERAMFGGSVILLLMAFVQSAEQLVLLRIIQGLITGTISAANALVAAVVPRERVGYAMGLLQVGNGIGVALGPLVGGLVADAFSYGAAFYVTAGTLFAGGLLVWLGVQEVFSPEEAQAKRHSSIVSEWRQILTTSGVIATFSLRFLTQFGRTMIIPIAPLFILSLMADASRVNTFTGLVFGVSSAATTLSAVYLGRLGDRTGHRNIFIITAFISAALFFIQSQVTAAWQLLLFQALVGLSIGGIIPAISAMLARLTSSGEAGAVYGLDNSIDAGSRSIAPLVGSMAATAVGLRSTFVASAVCFLLAGIVALRYLKKGGK